MSDLLERVRKRWDIDREWPEPKWSVLCPCCWEHEVMIRRWKYHESRLSPQPWRCDVMFKCRVCSMTWACGVPVPEEQYPGPISKHNSGVIEGKRR
jgi:hypothetical protein